MRPLRRRVLVGTACSAAVVGLARYGGSPALTATHPDPLSSVGDHPVAPGTRCQEDEAIMVPRHAHGPAVCVHLEGQVIEP